MSRVYTLTHSSGVKTVTPLNIDSLSYSWEYEKDFGFWRKKLSGSLVLSMDSGDYQYVYNIDQTDPCNILIFTITNDCGDVEFTGKFSTYIGKWDYDKCTFEADIDSVDSYTCITENLDQQIDLLSYYSPRYDVHGIIGTLERISVSIEEDHCGTTAITTTYYSQYNFTTNTWYTITTPPDLTKWCQVNFSRSNVDCEHEPNQPAHGRITTRTWIYEREVIVGTCDSLGNPVPPATGTWTYLSGSCAGGGTPLYYRCATATQANGSNIEVHNARPLLYVLDMAIKTICGISGIRSIFFNWNPNISDPIYALTNNGTLNYVTGQINALNNLLFSQITDIKDPSASNPATSAIISLQDLLKNICLMFNVRWFIDANNYMCFEHVSYFTRQQSTIDLMAGANLLAQDGKNSFEKTIEGIPKYEDFQFTVPEYVTSKQDWNSQRVYYNKNCAKSDAVIHEIDKIYTHTYDIITKPESYPDDAIVIIATDVYNGVRVMQYELGMASGSIRQNGHLSVANLLNHYYKHERPYHTATWNNTTLTFESWEPTIQQGELTLIHCCWNPTFDPSNYFITVLGNMLNSYAYVDSAKYKIKTNTLSVTFRYKINP